PPCASSWLFAAELGARLFPPSLHDALPISSSTLTRSSILALGSCVISLSLTMPVCLEPSMPTTHSVGETLMTLALTILPAYRGLDRKSTRLNSSHVSISYAVFCLKNKHFQE